MPIKCANRVRDCGYRIATAFLRIAPHPCFPLSRARYSTAGRWSGLAAVCQFIHGSRVARSAANAVKPQRGTTCASSTPRTGRCLSGACPEFVSCHYEIAGFSAGFREGGLKNRRLISFSFRFLNRPSEKRAVCAQKCAQTVVPKTTSTATIQSAPMVAFSVKGDGLNVVSVHRFSVERFRVSIFVSYTCRRAVRWPRG